MKKILFYVGIAVLASSCYSNKKLIYIQDKDISEQSPKTYQTQDFTYRLQPHDVLSVVVKSLDEVNSQIFNIQTQQNYGNITGDAMFLAGYSIDEEGNIKLPIVNEVHVAGMTLNEAQRVIQQEVDEYLVNSTVIVKLVSFKVAVLGEVNRPGYYYVFNNQANVLELIGMAGDIRESGNSKRVKLIRETRDGELQVSLLDLTEPALLESPNFYVLPNDILYVEHARAKISQENLGMLSLFFAGITATVGVLRLLVFNNN